MHRIDSEQEGRACMNATEWYLMGQILSRRVSFHQPGIDGRRKFSWIEIL